MIAMLLIAQLSAAEPMQTAASQVPQSPRPGSVEAFRVQPDGSLLSIRPRRGPCAWSGHYEVAFQPAALYRKGDRPPQMYLRWADYPEGRSCLLGGAP